MKCYLFYDRFEKSTKVMLLETIEVSGITVPKHYISDGRLNTSNSLALDQPLGYEMAGLFHPDMTGVTTTLRLCRGNKLTLFLEKAL